MLSIPNQSLHRRPARLDDLDAEPFALCAAVRGEGYSYLLSAVLVTCLGAARYRRLGVFGSERLCEERLAFLFTG